jgi:alpha-tubulin suppressor-like RCC1 family protein
MLCVPLRAGYTFWLAATDDGRLYTCDSQDDGYAGTLPQQRKPNNAGQLGRSGECDGRAQGAVSKFARTCSRLAAEQ